MMKRLLNSERIHFTAQSLARLQSRLEEVTCNLLCQCVGNQSASPLLVLNPRRMRQRYPHGMPIHEKLDVHCIRVARSDGHDQALIQAMDRFPGPAVGGGEVG